MPSWYTRLDSNDIGSKRYTLADRWETAHEVAVSARTIAQSPLRGLSDGDLSSSYNSDGDLSSSYKATRVHFTP